MSIIIKVADYRPIADGIKAVLTGQGKAADNSATYRAKLWSLYADLMVVLYKQPNLAKRGKARREVTETLLSFGANLSDKAKSSYTTQVKRLCEGSAWIVSEAIANQNMQPEVVEAMRSGNTASLIERLAKATYGHKSGFEKQTDITKARTAPVSIADALFKRLDALRDKAIKAGDALTLSAISARMPDWIVAFDAAVEKARLASSTVVDEEEEEEITVEGELPEVKKAA